MAADSVTTLIYSAPGKRLTLAEVRSAMAINDRMISVCLASGDAPFRGVSERTLLVIDLTCCDRKPPPPAVSTLEACEVILAVDEHDAVPVGWLDVVRSSSVLVVRIKPDHDRVPPQVATIVQSRFACLQDQLVAAILAVAPDWLSEFEQVVRVILRDPWTVRTPDQLARSIGITPHELTAQLRGSHPSVKRIEHVITLVRWLAFEHLIGPMHLASKRALSFIGVPDRSNLRRQWRRARYLVAGEAQARAV
jgi:hypothetical protein